MHLSRQGEVGIPALGLAGVELHYMGAAGASTGIDEGIVIDVLVGKLAEAMSAGLVLHHTTGVERIAVGALGAEGNGRTVVPHLADAAIVGRVGHHDDEGLVEVAFVHRGGIESVAEQLVVVGPEANATREGRIEPVVADGVYRAHARLGRDREGRINIEVSTVSLVRLNGEEVFHFLLHILEIAALCDVLGIVAVAEEHNVDAAAVALRGFLQGDVLVLAILVVVLADLARMRIVLVFELEDDAACTVGTALGHGLDGER